ncbi:Protein CBG28025 [Caenorhabditis briggsae]|uniref:Protein CBG28025 n=1 Tax=Caenorhabditis briggsae TaxID=6238 RepID=B6IG21_CAEBR|nr:Protein CBG28025 [Caenorhabditis briggsae]CAR98851.1 Protein CBG28025 [Caenorhabditis briggsae]
MSNFQQKSQPPDPNHSFTTFDIAQTKSSSERCVRQKNNFDTSVETSNMTEYNGQCSSSSAFQETNDYYPSSSESATKHLKFQEFLAFTNDFYRNRNQLLLRDQLLRKRRRRKKKKGLSAEQEERLEIGNFIRAIRKGIRIFQHTKAATQTSKSRK